MREERSRLHIQTRLAGVVDRMKGTSKKTPTSLTRMTRTQGRPSSKDSVANSRLNGFNEPRDSVNTHEDAPTLPLVSPSSRPTRAFRRPLIGVGNGDISLEEHASDSGSQIRSGQGGSANNSASSSDECVTFGLFV